MTDESQSTLAAQQRIQMVSTGVPFVSRGSPSGSKRFQAASNWFLCVSKLSPNGMSNDFPSCSQVVPKWLPSDFNVFPNGFQMVSNTQPTEHQVTGTTSTTTTSMTTTATPILVAVGISMVVKMTKRHAAGDEDNEKAACHR